MTDELGDHYRRRANRYEQIYFRPIERRLYEQEEIARAIREAMRNRRVLEVACGTGFWTVHAAAVAESVTATDGAEETLEMARQKPLDMVDFRRGDAYFLDEVRGDFDGGLACCWLSHVPRSRTDEFLSGFHRRLGRGSVVFVCDNMYVEGIGGNLVTDESGDTYKVRPNELGTHDRVLKNYFSREELEKVLGGNNLHLEIGTYFWWARYEL